MWPSDEQPHHGVFAWNVSQGLRAEGFEVSDGAVIRGKRRGRDKVFRHLGLLVGLSRQALGEADAIYVHAPSWFGPATLLAALARSKRLIAHTHGGEVYPHSRVERLAQPAVGAVLSRADLVIAPSRYYAGELTRAFSLPGDRLFVSPSGGIDTRRFVPGDRSAARARLGIQQGGPIVGYVGRIEADKGWETILAAVHELGVRGREVNALFCGAGSDLERLASRAEELHLTDRLILLGLRPQAELALVYQAMDVFLFPTDRGAESLGLVPLEAMACGVPVVGSDRFAVPEYVIPGQTGFLVPPKDAVAIADHVASILDLDDPERTRLRAACVERASEYDALRTAQALARRLDALLSAAPRRQWG